MGCVVSPSNNCNRILHAKDDAELALGAHFSQCTEELQIKNNLALVTGCQIRKELINYNQIALVRIFFSESNHHILNYFFGIPNSGLLREFEVDIPFIKVILNVARQNIIK